MGRRTFAFFLITLAAVAAGPRKLKPGFNLFSKQQDVQLGQEAAAQVEKQMTVVNDAELTAYLRRIGGKLAATPEAGGYPYSFKFVAEKSINAFALPGGPAFVHTGLLAAADNEAQVAGVLAHEISHVALRHGTNQVSKANLIQLPAVLAGAMAGGRGSMLGGLAQLGIQVGAGSMLLKFSRDAERDADLLGTRIMSRAGYNPIEMARFFEKLEAEGGARGPQFLSDHPNPGNRVKAVEAEIRYLPQRSYTTGDAGEFSRMQKRAAAVPVPAARPSAQQGGPTPEIPVSKSMKEYTGSSYRISYPDNWKAAADQQSPGVSLVPAEGVVQNGQNVAIGAGAIVGFHKPANGSSSLRSDTDDLLRNLTGSNPSMKVRSTKDTHVDGKPALLVTAESESPWPNEVEVDTVATVQRPDGLFFVVFVAPKSKLGSLQPAFDAMLRSIRF